MSSLVEKLVAVLFLASFSLAQPISKSTHSNFNRTELLQKFYDLPLGFERSAGADGSARFVSQVAGYSVELSRGEIAILFDQGSGARKPENVHIKLVGSDSMLQPEGIGSLPGVTNYYLGSDPAQWKTNVHQFREVRYRNIYPGIDLIFYGNRKQLEFDFDVAPGADASLIDMKFDGASVHRRKGNLELTTPSGRIATLKKPV